MNVIEKAAFAAKVLGRRYACDFVVVGVTGQTATVALRGAHYTLSLDELHTLIDRELVQEVWAH